jgi:ribA/ribD-fused uncharacterized protein
METKTEIYFYNLDNEFDYMSNFYKTQFTDENNITFNCSEQYFMYQKCLLFDGNNTKLLNKILQESSAMEIKKYGRLVKNYDDIVWNNVRYDIMKNALILKFTQNNNLKNKLLSTQTKTLYEASKYDKIWGIGFYASTAIVTDKNKFGMNLLGKCLMEVRDIINKIIL